MVEGKQYFNLRPYLCDVVTTICLTACVVSLFSIGGISFNRYIVICDKIKFRWLLTRRNIIITCLLFWCMGFILSLPALVGWTENIYDHKLLECFWNRLHSLSFTIFFSAGIVFTPIMIISFSFIKIYLHVRESRRRISRDTSHRHPSHASLHLATALFIIFAVFVFCWAPYSLLIVIDIHDRLPHEVYLFALLLAHLHSSLNWLVYALTHAHFRNAYKIVLRKMTFGLLFKSSNRRQGATGFSVANAEIQPLKPSPIPSPMLNSKSPCINTLIKHKNNNGYNTSYTKDHSSNDHSNDDVDLV